MLYCGLLETGCNFFLVGPYWELFDPHVMQEHKSPPLFFPHTSGQENASSSHVEERAKIGALRKGFCEKGKQLSAYP